MVIDKWNEFNEIIVINKKLKDVHGKEERNVFFSADVLMYDVAEVVAVYRGTFQMPFR